MRNIEQIVLQADGSTQIHPIDPVSAMPERSTRPAKRSWRVVAVIAKLAALVAIAVLFCRAAALILSSIDQDEMITLGAETYAERCGFCHGPRLQGQLNWRSPRADGKLGAPPLNSSGHTWHHDSASGTNHTLESRLYSSAGAVFPSRQAPIAPMPWERSVGIVPLAYSASSNSVLFLLGHLPTTAATCRLLRAG